MSNYKNVYRGPFSSHTKNKKEISIGPPRGFPDTSLKKFSVINSGEKTYRKTFQGANRVA